MPTLFGRRYTRAELERRTGRLDQIAGITPVELADGRSAGVRAFNVSTGSGFAFTALAGRALDVVGASYRGISLNWLSRNGIVAPEYYEPQGDEFLRTFFGGLFTTCGLANFGPAGSDRWGTFGLHGRIDALPAESIAARTRWDGDECVLEICGTVRQTRVFGEDLRLERRLRTTLGGNALQVHDVVTNDGGKPVPHMILYHCNAGFPLLDETSELHVSQAAVRPRDAQAEKGLGVWNRGGPPEAGFAEQVFIHEPVRCSDGRAAALLHNRGLNGDGLALAIRYDPSQLPALFTWRMLGYGTYVMGIEPANCPTIEGRVKAGELRTLPFLEPGESRTYRLDFEVLAGTEAIAAAIAAIAEASTPI
jgi:hypothetical protein